MEPFFRVGERTERPGRPGERFGVSKDLRVAASTVAGWRAAGLVPEVRQAPAEQEIPPVGPASARATNGQWSGSLCQDKARRGSARGPRRPLASPRSRPLRATSRAPTTHAKRAPLSHLRPRAVLESRAEVPGAPSVLAGPIAIHGPGGRSRVSEAWSPRPAGSHRRRGAGDAESAGRSGAHGGARRAGGAGPRGRRGRGACRVPVAARRAGRRRSLSPSLFLSRAGSFRVWPPRGPPRRPAASPALPSQVSRPLARSRPAQSPARPPPLGKRETAGHGPEGEGQVRLGDLLGGGH